MANTQQLIGNKPSTPVLFYVPNQFQIELSSYIVIDFNPQKWDLLFRKKKVGSPNIRSSKTLPTVSDQ